MTESPTTPSKTELPNPPGIGLHQAGLELVLASFVVLFQELALIRWLPAQVRVVAYFPNLILIAAFLGLGIGSLRARNRSLLWLWPVSLFVIAGCAIAMSGVAFTANTVSEHLWLLYDDLPEGAPVIEGVRLPLIVLFILSSLTFVPLGQFVGQRLNLYRERSSPLWGYVMDLTGSLLGVVVFGVASFLGLFPVTWFTLLMAAGTFFFLSKPRLLGLYLPAAFLLVGSVHLSEGAEHYSPYYALELTSDLTVRTNGSMHQRALPVAMGDVFTEEWPRQVRSGYHLPFELLGRPPGKVLVLGAGTGNDVAVALDEGAEEVHAVEIDPVILDMGREFHPNHPYDSPRVKIFNTDARSFLNDTQDTYDLIVFGTLDSMTQLSAMSKVRLDNFVYTTDALREAKARLRPQGGMVLYFMVNNRDIESHLTAMLGSAFGEFPAVYRGMWALFNHVFLAGPAFETVETGRTGMDIEPLLSGAASLSLPSDDWPYLYLPDRGVNGFYLSLMAVFFGLAVAGVLLASPQFRRGLARGEGVDLEMFLFGFAFLLIETRFVTAMNLVWGATWLTSAVVFGSILATILLGTVLMEVRPIGWRVASLGLVAALLLIYLVPASALLTPNMVLRLAGSLLYVGMPVFFAAACFALLFKEREAVDRAFGWNLLGAVAGGLVEFFSMSFGLAALVLLALAAYILAFVARDRKTSRQIQRG